jgi:predicted AlkP superfamily phosphohydrolase/phosphomutase
LLLIAALATTVTLALACSSATRGDVGRQKLVILGFDGLDPDLTAAWIKEGKLPNLAKLALQGGGLHQLETTPSPDGAPAWASFATGVNPGKHNIFDSVSRDAATYEPGFTVIKQAPAKFLFNYVPLGGPRFTSMRSATSFWVMAGAAGIRSSILTVPMTFPPEDIPNGELLAGTPLPDVRGSNGRFSYFATDVVPSAEGPTEFGGLVKRLTFEGNVAHAELFGPSPPNGEGALTIPFAITWNREARSANIDVDGQMIHLGERAWSRWVELDFKANALTRTRGMAQFYLIRAGTNLQLYVSGINWHPVAPPAAMTSPPSFARDLYDRLGAYRTGTSPESSWALADAVIDEAAFIEDLDHAFEDRAQTILHRVESGNWDLLVGVIDTTDRVQHLMWRMTDRQHPLYDAELARRHSFAIEHMYRRADEFVGEVMQRLESNTKVMVLSTHGFHPYRWSVNLNSWLVQTGLLTLQGQTPQATTDVSPSEEEPFGHDVDWPRSRAYAVGHGQIYVNLKGRERDGLVAPGAEYDQLLDALVSGLVQIRDPRSGARVVRNVYKRDAVYGGPFVSNAADLQVGFEEGYRASWQTGSGVTPARVIEPNMNRWSGDHSSVDYQITAGVLITNMKPTAERMRVIDIAPTVLKMFGLPVPADMDGKPIF